MRSCTAAVIVLTGVLFQGCAIGAPNGAKNFPREVRSQVFNEVLGEMEHVLILERGYQAGGDCFYRAKETYLDTGGKEVRIQGANKRVFTLVGIDDATCSAPADKLIRLVDMQEKEFFGIRDQLVRFMSGKDAGHSSGLPALLGIPVVIAKKSDCYELSYTGEVNRIICVDFSEDVPQVRAIRSWQ